MTSHYGQRGQLNNSCEETGMCFLLEKLMCMFSLSHLEIKNELTQKQPFRGVLRKRLSENMQHIYRRTLMPKCDFNKVANPFYETSG